ncbi:MAG: Hydrogenase maturation factor HypF [Candidatus Methanohalarchaeum thermophilum]|uniref:Carbamoyltransferase n=1 Tax=Methanohalarchaeum thermophilum TaxID=1903181 RepID=A0A1Q6DTB8_METT1|nr:MAG: Hydrogenase maturation factor HypF [Candidatus Methanohalarchaeum thermophilum]
MKRAEIRVNGIVQAVGFRPFVYRKAIESDLTGGVRNLGGAGVDIYLEGKKEDINSFLSKLKNQNPPLAQINEIKVNWTKPKGLNEFKILESLDESSGTGIIPSDTAICEDCLEDIKEQDNRFFNYWATSCVNCGPRYTIIKKLPYDRENTSMTDFPMCSDCSKEYKNPMDRRYHAQTIACPKCGPKTYLEEKENQNPIIKSTRLLKENKILAIKGIGGTHLACRADKDSTVKKLRTRLKRPNQPFAIMAKDIEMANKFAEISKKEKKYMKSLKRPITLLNKRKNNPLSKFIAPGLHNIGVMLPYSGLHHLLFNEINFPLVMTSANLPGEPMYIRNKNIKEGLKDIADNYLLHNRNIVTRCDDSVIRVNKSTGLNLIRRSRGYAPKPIKKELGENTILALGAELDNTIALYNNKNCYISQYIGDIDNLKTFKFMKKTIDHLMDLTNIKSIDKVVCDLHPNYQTTKYAEEISDPIKVQHHHAHMASILGEKDLKEIVGIAIDGAGYGGEREIWGGEIMVATKEDFKRKGGLIPQPMPGGDLCTKYPARMIAGILYSIEELSDILNEFYFPHGKEEIHNVIKQIKNSTNVFKTSSAGRFLDSVSTLLNICEKRTYEGEPAMKLESCAKNNEGIELELEYEKKNKKIYLDTRDLLIKLMKLKDEINRSKIAATAQENLAKGLSKIAIETCKEKGIKNIGLSGGVSYNNAISHQIKKEIEKEDLNLLTNKQIPPGDGGTSFGQLIVASEKADRNEVTST